MFSEILYLLALISPFLHWACESVRASYAARAACHMNSDYRIDDALFSANQTCEVLHFEFLYIMFIIAFVAVPLCSAAMFGIEHWDAYIDIWKQIHDRLILAMFQGSAITLLLLSVFLATWLLGYGIFAL
ncbi:NS7 protein [Myotis bat coronavirus]|nr:NS7 protein [Myotis bat coronavirus]